jgi:OmpA-OmpF porin, OOP family
VVRGEGYRESISAYVRWRADRRLSKADDWGIDRSVCFRFYDRSAARSKVERIKRNTSIKATMKTTPLKKPLNLALACALALGFASGAARAADVQPTADHQLWNNVGAQVWKNGSGECWQNAYGPPLGSDGCNPQPVAQNAAQPVLAAAAPQPVVQKVTFDADALFDFDKAVLRPEGKTALDAFVGQLGGVDVAAITAVGHTDRFGSKSYNQTLSERRAASVKDYLVAKGIQPGSVQTRGMGETQPVTKTGECAGRRSAKVVACLQPDRRVEVELTGTRMQ